MDFIPESLAEYSENHTSKEPALLAQLNRETNLKVLHPRMLSGHLQGRFLSLFSKIVQPKKILEIGTYTGYSALCLLEGLSNNGELITIDVNAELESICRRYFEESGRSDSIRLIIGNALEIIPELNEEFDIVFMDADKNNYLNYYHLVFDKVRPGGFIIIDNVLWSGKVVEPIDPKDEDTSTLVALNKLIQEDERVENLLLPLRDGLMIARKK